MILPRIAAIYRIICLVTGAAYIGCTDNAQKRWREHRSTLRRGIHCTKPLQQEWARYGEASFRCEVLECLEPGLPKARKRERETYWFNAHPGRLLCNPLCSFAGTPESIVKAIEASRTVAGNRWTPEANRLRSVAQKGIPKGHGAKISATKRARKLERERQLSQLMI